jgi:hypothetical protein
MQCIAAAIVCCLDYTSVKDLAGNKVNRINQCLAFGRAKQSHTKTLTGM